MTTQVAGGVSRPPTGLRSRQIEQTGEGPKVCVYIAVEAVVPALPR